MPIAGCYALRYMTALAPLRPASQIIGEHAFRTSIDGPSHAFLDAIVACLRGMSFRSRWFNQDCPLIRSVES